MYTPIMDGVTDKTLKCLYLLTTTLQCIPVCNQPFTECLLYNIDNNIGLLQTHWSCNGLDVNVILNSQI